MAGGKYYVRPYSGMVAAFAGSGTAGQKDGTPPDAGPYRFSMF